MLNVKPIAKVLPEYKPYQRTMSNTGKNITYVPGLIPNIIPQPITLKKLEKLHGIVNKKPPKEDSAKGKKSAQKSPKKPKIIKPRNNFSVGTGKMNFDTVNKLTYLPPGAYKDFEPSVYFSQRIVEYPAKSGKTSYGRKTYY